MTNIECLNQKATLEATYYQPTPCRTFSFGWLVEQLGGREGEGREISLRTRPRPALGAGHQAPRQVVLNCPKMGPASQKEMFNKEGRRISRHFSNKDRLFSKVLVKSSTKLAKGKYFFAARLKTQLAFCLAGFDSVEEKLLSFLSDMLCFRTKTKQRIKQQRKGWWNGMKKLAQ